MGTWEWAQYWVGTQVPALNVPALHGWRMQYPEWGAMEEYALGNMVIHSGDLLICVSSPGAQKLVSASITIHYLSIFFLNKTGKETSWAESDWATDQLHNTGTGWLASPLSATVTQNQLQRTERGSPGGEQHCGAVRLWWTEVRTLIIQGISHLGTRKWYCLWL